MGTRSVTGSVLKPDGTAWYPGNVTFELMAAFETSTTVYPAMRYTEALDAAGAFSVVLSVPDGGTATAHYKIGLPDGTEHQVYIAAGATVDLATLLTIAGTSAAQDDLQTLMDTASTLATRDVAVSDDIEDTDEVLFATVAGITLTLPAATGSKKPYCVKNVTSGGSAGSIYLAAQSGETIDGVATQTISSMMWTVVIDRATDTWNII